MSERIDLKVYVWGDTTGDVLMALDEVKRLVGNGMTSGFDKNETGGFRFDINGEGDADE